MSEYSLPAIALKRAGSEDIAAIEALRAEAGWDTGVATLHAMLATHSLILLACHGEITVGCGAAVRFGEAGFINNMLVRQEWRGRGIGTTLFSALLDWLTDAATRCIQLDATPAGQPLYARFGFVPRWRALRGTLERPPLPPLPDSAIAPPEPHDWETIATLDARAFGAPRADFLRALSAAPGSRTLVFRAGGQIVGYGMARPGEIGPVIAVSAHVAERLGTALAAQGEPGDRLIVGNRAAATLWRRCGFAFVDGSTRMVRGPATADRPDTIFAQINAAMG